MNKDTKYDVVIGHWQHRILQSVSKDTLETYCKAHNLTVVSDRAIGLVYREVIVSKVNKPVDRL